MFGADPVFARHSNERGVDFRQTVSATTADGFVEPDEKRGRGRGKAIPPNQLTSTAHT
jgi:hypothetical protein